MARITIVILIHVLHIRLTCPVLSYMSGYDQLGCERSPFSVTSSGRVLGSLRACQIALQSDLAGELTRPYVLPESRSFSPSVVPNSHRVLDEAPACRLLERKR